MKATACLSWSLHGQTGSQKADPKYHAPLLWDPFYQKTSWTHYERGFDCLTQALRKQGNLVTSPPADALKKGSRWGTQNVFGHDLVRAGAFSQITLIGHSGGSMDIQECAQNLPGDGGGQCSSHPIYYNENAAPKRTCGHHYFTLCAKSL